MRFLFVLLICLFSTCIFADVAQLNSLLQNFSSLKANFSEVMTDQQGNKMQSSGVLYIKKPDQFHWETSAPNSELYISNGHTVWSVEPDLQQVTVSRLSQNLSTTPLLLLSGDVTDLTKVFTVQQQDATHYILIPKDQDSMIAKIVLGFDQKGIVNTLEMTNTMGQTSMLQLRNVILNEALPASLFTYVPVPGMDVLQQ